jgi:Tfp pilus assembly protein PilP
MLTVCVQQQREGIDEWSNESVGLYRSLLRESNKVTHYNMREYSLRSVRTRFRENLAERKTNTLARHLSLIRFCFHYLIDNSKKVNELVDDASVNWQC